MNLNQLLDPPSEIDTSKFTNDVADWLRRLLLKLHIKKPSPPAVSTNYSPSLCCNSSRLTLFCCCRRMPLPLVADAQRNPKHRAQRHPKNRLRMLRSKLVQKEAHRRRPLTLLRGYLPRTPPPSPPPPLPPPNAHPPFPSPHPAPRAPPPHALRLAELIQNNRAGRARWSQGAGKDKPRTIAQKAVAKTPPAAEARRSGCASAH